MSDQPDLTLLMTMVQRVLTEQTAIRDDMAVLTAIAMRQDGTLSALLTELRAIHTQHSRLAGRVRALEENAS